MLPNSWKQLLAASVLGVVLTTANARDVHAQQGMVTGRVTDRASNRPVEQVQVAIVGTTLGGLTNADGAFTIRGVPVGTAQVRALRVGYTEQRQSVAVTAGQSVTANFAMESVPVSLAPVVTTATGEQRRVEIGNALSTVNVADVAKTAPVANIADVLESRAPGVVVSTGGQQTGSGARIRIRGQSSLALSNDPIYVIDGVRMTSNSNSSAFGTGGSIPSRVGDLNPEEIENIEIVKGPSAATLYGTDAANGVIVITTKKGRAGAPKWTVYGEGGALSDRNTYPTAYSLAGHSPGSTAYRDCVLSQIASGNCVADSVRSLNLFNVDSLTPVGLGNRHQLGAQVSGGTDVVRYFLSGENEQEVGTLKLPDFERRSVQPHESADPGLRRSAEPAREKQLPREPQLDDHAEARHQRQLRVHRPRAALLARVERDGRCRIASLRRARLHRSGDAEGRERIGNAAQRLPRVDAGLHVAGEDRSAHQPVHRRSERKLAGGVVVPDQRERRLRPHRSRRGQSIATWGRSADHVNVSTRLQE